MRLGPRPQDHLSDTMNPRWERLMSGIDALLPEIEEVYEDLHRHPELSMREFRTALGKTIPNAGPTMAFANASVPAFHRCRMFRIDVMTAGTLSRCAH
jgi:hypothetical protein